MNSTTWTAVADCLSYLAPMLAIGTTLFLALGCVLVILTRSPVHRQRLGELTLLGVLAWSVLAFVPMPRMVPELRIFAPSRSVEQVAATETEPAIQLEALPDAGDVASDKTVETNRWQAELPVALTADEPDSLRLPANPAATQIMAELPIPTVEPAATLQRQIPMPANSDAVSNTPAVRPDFSVVPAQASPIQPSWPAVLLRIYLVAAFLCTAWLLIGQALLVRIRRQALPASRWLVDLFDSLTPGESRPRAELLVSTHCQRALSWGIRRPAILIPLGLCRRENEGQLRTILLHELGHVAQRDAWGNLLICLAIPLLYFHPLFWWLRIQIRLAAELVADDWAAQQTGKETYVEDLVTLAKTTRGRGSLLPGVTGVLSSPSQFYRRMNMLLAREEPLITRPSIAWRLTTLGMLLVAVTLATSVAGIHPAAGQTTAENATPPVAAPPPATTPAATTPPAAEPARTPDVAPVTAVTVEGELPAATVPALPAPPAAANALTPQNLPTPSGVVPANAAPNNEIETEKAQLRAELRKLTDRLQALERSSPNSAAPSIVVGTSRGARMFFDRVLEDGKMVTETWAVDETGRANKLISRTDVPLKGVSAQNSFQESGIAIQAQGQAGGVVSVAEKTENGDLVIRQYGVDAEGRRQELRSIYKDPNSQPGKTPPFVVAPRNQNRIEPRVAAEPGAPYPMPPVPVAVPMAVTQAAIPRTADGQGQAAQPLDLVSLATSYADAVGAVESAKAVLDAAQERVNTEANRDASLIARKDLITAQIGLKNAERKEKLLRQIVTSAKANTERHLARIAGLQQKGYVAASESQDAESRLEILNQILDSDSKGAPQKGDEKLQQR